MKKNGGAEFYGCNIGRHLHMEAKPTLLIKALKNVLKCFSELSFKYLSKLTPEVTGKAKNRS